MKNPNFLLTLALCATSFSAFAGPYLTDEAETVEFQKWEMEFSGTLVDAKDSPNEKGVAVEFRYGLMTDVDVFLELGYDHVSKDKNGDDVIPALHGVADSEAGFKYRFIKETCLFPQVAFAPTIGIPTGNSSKVGNGKAWYELPLWLEKNWDGWSTSGGLGVVFNDADEAKDFMFAGWKVQHDLTEQLNMGVELFYQGRDSDDSRNLTLVNLGSEYKVNDVLSLQASLGHSLHGEPQTIAYLGFKIS
jgi:hypothetical protein